MNKRSISLTIGILGQNRFVCGNWLTRTKHVLGLDPEFVIFTRFKSFHMMRCALNHTRNLLPVFARLFTFLHNVTFIQCVVLVSIKKSQKSTEIIKIS